MNVSGSPLKALGGDECLGQSGSHQQGGAAKAAGTRLLLNGRTHVLLNTQTPHEQDTHKYFCLTSNDKKIGWGEGKVPVDY